MRLVIILFTYIQIVKLGTLQSRNKQFRQQNEQGKYISLFITLKHASRY